MKILVKYSKYYGRMGTIHGMFVCHDFELPLLYGKRVYFGEILGKHSEVVLTFDEEDFIIYHDEDLAQKLEDFAGSKTMSGYNPLNYIESE